MKQKRWNLCVGNFLGRSIKFEIALKKLQRYWSVNILEHSRKFYEDELLIKTRKILIRTTSIKNTTTLIF